MIHKDKNKKTTCSENKAKLSIPAKVVAEMVGCSEAAVKAIRSGARNAHTDTGKQIVLVETLLSEGSNALLNEVKKIVKIQK